MTLDNTQMEHFPSLARLRPPRVVTTVAWLIFVGIALAVAILFVPWLQTAQGGGQVTTLNAEDRARDVSSLVGGRVEEFYVKDGDFVHAGDPIVRVVDIDPDHGVGAEAPGILRHLVQRERARLTKTPFTQDTSGSAERIDRLRDRRPESRSNRCLATDDPKVPSNRPPLQRRRRRSEDDRGTRIGTRGTRPGGDDRWHIRPFTLERLVGMVPLAEARAL